MIAKVRNQTLDGFAGLGVVTHDTMAEYEALSEEEKMDGNVHLVLEEEPINANIVEYTDGKTVKDELDDIAEKTGNTDISAIGDGTTTGAIGSLNTHLTQKGTIVLLGSAPTPTTNNTPVDITVSNIQPYNELMVEYGFGYGNTFQYRYFKINDYQKVSGIFALVRVNNTTIRVTTDGVTGASGSTDAIKIYGVRS